MSFREFNPPNPMTGAGVSSGAAPTPAPAPTPASAPDPYSAPNLQLDWTCLSISDIAKGISQDDFNLYTAKEALLDMPVNYIQGVQNFIEGTSTLDQNTKLFEQLSTYAKTYGVGLGFHSQSKQAEVAVTDAGNIYTLTDDGEWTQMYTVYKGSSDYVDAEQRRVSAYAASGPAMIDDADTDITNQGLDPMAGMVSERKFAAKRQPDKVYANPVPFHVRNPGSGKQSTTTKYSYVVTQMSSELNGSYLLVANRR